MIDVADLALKGAREVLAMARSLVLRQGALYPTAVLHTREGLTPLVLPFKNSEQKRAMVTYVQQRALDLHAYAVTTVTCARVVDSRTREEEESIICVTTVQGGAPLFMAQTLTRDEQGVVICFGDVEEGDSVCGPGQMMILPEWDRQTRH
jgi:hypothetical protein